ncbi:GNAT family N-acetyltransferase [Moritella viscosa]|uniref:Acetyltransferase n=2 Tax=Moritella viscosa TaxID=80854 RepID=A0ABY1HG60_9GAMM|nr:GNAT family N-acetyltransferase [Moritella viscosa]SGY97166.1 Putative acetyltransferase [Moritella viscosa]SGZ10247.1 Putative acetyltransferase [Moritella viscosa]SHO27438.1 Putative acetyltransferase [Moritella viscosa]
MEFTFEKVTHRDLDLIFELGESVNEEHVVPLLNAEGQKAIRIAFKADIEQVKNPEIYSAVKATIGNEIIGYIAWREENYIGHLYVKTEYHGFGVAKRLVEEMKQVSSARLIRVKASIYALGFYGKVGFKAMSEELSINGIRYVPMELNVNNGYSL